MRFARAAAWLGCVLCCGLVVFAEQEAPEDAEEEEARSVERARRSLVYPSPSTLLLIFGLGTPLQLDRESVIVGAFAKMIHALPSNSSDFTEPGVVHAARAGRPPRSRWSLYGAAARLADLYGLGEGRACLMRAICEAAGAPFDARQGLLHQLLQAFLSPSGTSEEYEEYGDREYRAAEELGRRAANANAAGSCHALYPECRRSPLDVFSRVGSALLG